jgi:hypothetical protein
MLQLARSMGVGVILANQSMQDLRKSTTNLIPAIEANCRLRQWFSVSSSDDQLRLVRSSGMTIDTATTVSQSRSSDGKSSSSVSQAERPVERFTLNDVLLTSDHPFRSFLRISRGAGYAQYGGLPVIIESGYHITSEEYQRRRGLPWPTGPGTFVPRPTLPGDSNAGGISPTPSAAAGSETRWSEEVIGEDNSAQVGVEDMGAIDELFRQLKPESRPAPTKKRRRKLR